MTEAPDPRPSRNPRDPPRRTWRAPSHDPDIGGPGGRLALLVGAAALIVPAAALAAPPVIERFVPTATYRVTGEVAEIVAATADGMTLLYTDSLTALREPDAIAWTSAGRLVTANEGDYPTGEDGIPGGREGQRARAHRGW